MADRVQTSRVRLGGLRLVVAGITDRGRSRDAKPNEDAWAAILPRLLTQRSPLLVLADGMGGHGGGEQASAVVVDTIRRQYRRRGVAGNPKETLERLIQEAHKEIRRIGSLGTSHQRMGSTVVAALIGATTVTLTNVGDSRAYLVRGDSIAQLTMDHSWVGAKVRAGELTPLEARSHPERNRLTMSLSAARRPEDVTPYFAEFETRAEDVLVLCSDGLWAVLTDSEIKAVVTDLSLADAARKLVAMANASHGPDNITAVLALFKPRGVQQESPSAPVEEDATGPGL